MPTQLTVKGRLVWGHPGELEKKTDAISRQPVLKDGQPVMQCSFGVAIERNEFYQNVLPVLINEARSAFPQASFNGQSFLGVPPKFAWKYKDGETDIDDKGKPYREREGYAGHVVLTVSTTGFCPDLYRYEGSNPVRITKEEMKTGYYIAVGIVVKYNGVSGTGTPGLYINPEGVVLLGYMPEIVGQRRDPNELFAGIQATALPAGVSAMPLMPAGGMPNVAPAPQQYAPAPQQYAPVAAPQQPLPAPAHDFVQNATGGHPQQPASVPYTAPGTPQPAAYNPTPQSQPYGVPAAPYGMPGMPAGR